MRKLLSIFFLTLAYTCVSAQINIKGVILDGTNGDEPMIGANVLVKGTTNGTITDLDGAFELNVPKGAVLVISSIGYKNQEIKITNQTSLKISMLEDTEVLEDIVVVGYGTMRKVDLTGSVGSVSGDKLRESVIVNADQMLQGRVAGVQVSANSGAPGAAASIRVRGASSINGDNEPLYIIDGIPMNGSGTSIAGFDWAGGSNGQNRVSPLAAIAPGDIVSMDVLKDASACAIYGAAGANGVVIITTKHGKEGKVNISYDGYIGIQTFAKKLNMMNLQEYAAYQQDLYNEGYAASLNDAYRDISILGKGTDWQDAIIHNALMHSHTLSLTGGVKSTQFAVSGNYANQDGTIKGSDFERYSLRTNIDHEFGKYVKVGGSVSYARTKEKIIQNDGVDGILMQALTMQPDVPVKNFDGNYAGPSTVNSSTAYNPVAMAQMKNNTLVRDRIMGGIYAQGNILPVLNVRTEFSFDINLAKNTGFVPTYKFGSIENNINKIFEQNDRSTYWLWKTYATYDQTFKGKHTVGAMVGFEMSKSAWEGSSLQKKNLSSNDIQVMTTDGDYVTNNGWKDFATTMSVFGRFNYNYDNRYLATFTIRGDASSKFGPNNRWGCFPSVALAWRMSEEPWLKDIEEITNLKIRVGYGQVGNSNIDNYLFSSKMMALITPMGTAYRMSNFANPDLKWEASEQWNVGVDIALIKNRIDLSIDLYEKNTKDLLLTPSVPAILGGEASWDGIATPMQNIGKVRNRGIDISLNVVPVDIKLFSWTSNIVISVNRNKVMALDKQNTPIYGKLDWYSEFQTATIITEGNPMGCFYGFETDGYFMNEEEIKKGPVQVDNGKGENRIDRSSGVWIGDIRYKDLNGDGKITDADQKIIGDPTPLFTLGWSNTFRIWDFDLGINFTGSVGGKILNYTRVKTEGMNSLWDNQATSISGRVQYGYVDGDPTNKTASNMYVSNNPSMPRWSTTDVNRNNRMSDRWIEDGSYLRISNLSLAYNFPSALMKKAHMTSLRLYFNAQNVWTFTKYSGFDPEIGAYNQQAGMTNIDMGRYPSPRVFTFGVNLVF
ncbi:MAG: TonB-dependent receptor [Paludibacteraceae bacterium]|nr:TonB-dependent receptor [Bacteroidales bacterium]MCQ2330665.1 TonB-dependent receptor [Paludibacteraceae bacterium]